MNNEVLVNDNQDAPGAAKDVIKQQPNNGIWIFSPSFGIFLSPGLGLHSWGKGTEESFFSRIGDPPVLLDSTKTEIGSKQLQTWFFNRGYFNASSSYHIDSLRKNDPKAQVHYHITTGRQYFLKNLDIEGCTDEQLRLLRQTQSKTVLFEKRAYDAKNLENERNRVAKLFKSKGYYSFSKSYISYEVDTLLAGDSVDVRMIIAKRLEEIDGETQYVDHQIFRIKEVYIRPDLDLKNLIRPSDTLIHNNYKLIFNQLKYKPRYFTDAIHISESQRYDEEAVKRFLFSPCEIQSI